MRRSNRLLKGRKIRMGSYAALLVAMIAYLFLAAVAQERGTQMPWITLVLFPVILFATIGSAAETRRQLFSLIGLGAIVFVADLLKLGNQALWLGVINRGVHILFLLLTIVLILRHVFREAAVGPDMILGAACAYLLIGLAFNHVYAMIEVLAPGSFAGRVAVSRDGGYFSLVTLSTLGYGDVVPTRGVARSLAALEAVVGQFYIAVIVARLVAMQMVYASPRSRTEPEDQA